MGGEVKRYEVMKSFKKGAIMACSIGVGILSAFAAIGNAGELRQIPIAVGISAIGGAIRAGVNWYKQHAGDDGGGLGG